MRGEKILITGGAGFVGSQLGQELHRRGVEVTLLDDMSFGHLDNLIFAGETFGEFVVRDIRDPDFENVLEGVDTIFHFAGIAPLPVCQAQPMRAFDVNTGGTANVLECARRAGVRRVIFSSTSAVYECNDTLPHSVDDEVRPNLVYATTKVCAEKVCKGFADNYGMDIIVCRFFNVYGPHQDMKRKSPPFTSYVARELAAGRVPTLFNDSDARRDYVHSSDVTELLVRMWQSERAYGAEIFNVGSGDGYSVPFLYDEFKRISGRDIEPVFADPEGYWDAYPDLFLGRPLSRGRIRKEVYKDSIADIEKTKAEFDWVPRIGIEEGLRSVYEYVAAHVRDSEPVG